MPDFDSIRRQQVEGYYASVAGQFLGSFRPDKHTVVLVPGLLGSELAGSKKPWNELPPQYDRNSFETVWGDKFLVKNFPNLALDEELHDRPVRTGKEKWRVILPDGDFKLGILGVNFVQPYAPFLKFVAEKGWNCLVFAYDWRRSVQSNAVMLGWTLRHLLAQPGAVTANLARFTLAGHSMGGLVVKAFLDLVGKGAAGTITGWPGKAITIGTPHYGSILTTYALFKGDDDLNQTGPHAELSMVPEVICTMPGFADLMLLPLEQYNQLQGSFGQELAAYPVTDKKSNQAMDLFGQEALRRYPKAFSLNLKALGDAMPRVTERGEALPASVADCLYVMRSSVDTKTRVGVVWEPRDKSAPWVPVPERSTPPPMRFLKGGGDGVVPHWSARLAGVPAGRVIELTKARKHSALQNHEEVLEHLEKIVEGS